MYKNCFLNCYLVYNEEIEETDSETGRFDKIMLLIRNCRFR